MYSSFDKLYFADDDSMKRLKRDIGISLKSNFTTQYFPHVAESSSFWMHSLLYSIPYPPFLIIWRTLLSDCPVSVSRALEAPVEMPVKSGGYPYES